jgi:hypothetical protein
MIVVKIDNIFAKSLDIFLQKSRNAIESGVKKEEEN